MALVLLFLMNTMVSGLFELMHSAGGVICSHVHPLEGSVLLPLCARCTGLYLACALGILAGIVWPMEWGRAAFVLSRRAGLTIAALLVGITVAHALWATEAPDLERLAAGAVGGIGIAYLLGARFLPTVTTAAVLVVLAATRSPAVFTVLALATPLAVLVILLVGTYRVAKGILWNAESVDAVSGTFFADETEEAAPGGVSRP